MVFDSEIIEHLLQHPSYNNDFIKVDEEEVDPYLDKRRDSEPQHIHAEIEHGTLKKVEGGPRKIDPKLQKLISNEAIKMAKEMAPKLAVEFLKDLKEKSDAESENVKDVADPEKTAPAKKKSGRSAKKTSVKVKEGDK